MASPSFSTPEEPVNPFAAPEAEIGARPADFVSDTEAEAIRRAHIGHEASVQSVGVLYYLGAVFLALATVGILISAMSFATMPMAANPGPAGLPPRAFLFGFGAFYAAMTALNLALGYGLRRLQVWARWTVAVLMGLSLLYCLLAGAAMVLLIDPVAGMIALIVGGGISGYIFYLMVSPKGAMVFSAPYKEIIAQTPHIRYRTSLLVKVVLVIFVAFIVLGIVAALVGRP